MNKILQSTLATGLALVLLGTARAQTPATLTDFGSTAPTPGPDDISQLLVGTGSPDGLNYYYDNSAPPGQTFTTGSNPNGYVLTSLSVATTGIGGNFPAAGQAYVLRIYSVSGTNALLVASYISTNNFTYVSSYWLQWTDLSGALPANGQYAYSFARTSAGYENMANVSANPLAGGEVALIPVNGGTMTLGASHDFDASFIAGLTPASSLSATVTIAPRSAVVAGTSATLSAFAVGPGPLYYQWQTDGGSGGTLTNIPSANSSTLPVNTTGLAVGPYRYAVVVTNSSSAVYISVATLAVTLPVSSATLTDAGITISPQPTDITQFAGGGNHDGLNYYHDNGAARDAWTGQTFTTGTNSQGYYLTSVAVQTGGGGSSGTGTPQAFSLFIYQMSGNTASLMAQFTNSNFSFVFGDWLKWSGFQLTLKSNTTYAYAFGRQASGTGWASLDSSPTNTDLYTGGQMCLVSASGGTVTYGASGNADAVFDIGMLPIGVGPDPKPFAGNISVSPSLAVAGGTQVTLNQSAAGAAPLQFQWRTDGGSGTLTNISTGIGTNLVVDTTSMQPGRYKFDFRVSNIFGSSTSSVVTLTVVREIATVLLTDIGFAATAPTPAPLDISQLTYGTGNPPGLNYYFDNANPPGQTLTTGSNPGGYTLTSVAMQTAGGSGQLPAAGQSYTLRIYSVSGSTATLYAIYTSQGGFTFTDTDWLRFSGFALILAPNSVYAYTLQRSTAGWENLANVAGDTYTGGQAVVIPTSGGTINAGSAADSDATFIAGLALAGYPNVSPAAFSTPRIIYAGTPVTVSASVTGAALFTSAQWQTDGGNVGVFTNIPGALNTNLLLNTTGLDGLTVSYRLEASNGSGPTIGEAGTLTINSASTPMVTLGFDTTPVSPSRFIGGTVTFSARFEGTEPISYQWQVHKGSTFTNIIGQTNTTLTLSNLQVSDTGYYQLFATNSLGSSSSAASYLTVHSTPLVGTTVNFQWHSTEGGDVGNYTGQGIPGFGTGTYWNQVPGPATWTPGTYTSSGGLADDGSTDIGISWILTTGGSWSQTTDSTVPLLDSYAMAYTGTPRTFTFNLPNGLYNIVLFSCNGSETSVTNSAALFTINGVTNTAIPTQHSSFVQGNNYVVFSNVVVTTTSLSGTWVGTPEKSFGSLSGAQLRYLSSVNSTPTSVAAQISGGNLNISWPADHAGWTLQAQTNGLSTGISTNWVDIAGSSVTTQMSVPINPNNGSVFYRLILRQ